VAKCLLQHLYVTTRCLPLHELLEEFTLISSPNSIIFDRPPLRFALDRNVWNMDDVAEILEFLVACSPERCIAQFS
jgi:hypothetical protein